MQRDSEPVSNVDWVMVIASVLFFIGSFLPLATVSISLGLGASVSGSLDSWHSYGIAGMLIGLAGIGLWVMMRFGLATLPPGPNWPLIAGGAILLGTVLVFIRGVVYSGESATLDGQVVGSAGLGYGAFIVLITGIVAAACAGFRARVDELATRAVGSARVAGQSAQRARAERQQAGANGGKPEPASAAGAAATAEPAGAAATPDPAGAAATPDPAGAAATPDPAGPSSAPHEPADGPDTDPPGSAGGGHSQDR
jgi:hypothetical protein